MDIFEQIAKRRDEVPEAEQKEMAASIVDILKGYHITYSQAFLILDLVRSTLHEMSHTLMM